MSMKQAFTIILGVCFTALGTGLLAGAYLLSGRERRLGARGASARGAVVGLEERRGSRGGRSYAPVVRFSTERGQEIEFTAALGSNPAAYSVGDEVPVSYNPERPGSADVDDFASRWFGPLALLALGTIFTALGVYGIIPYGRASTPVAAARR